MTMSDQTGFGQPRSLAEMLARREAFLRDGVPLDFIAAQVALARRQRNQEMAEAVLGLLRMAKRWLLPPRGRGRRVSAA